MRRIFWTIGVALLAIIGVGLVFLLEAHWEIRSVAPALPDRQAIDAALEGADGPVQIRYVNTASQGAAGRRVIHPAYVLEWADGRIFLVEVGMDREGAAAFGRTMERLLGSAPIEIYGSVAEQMGGDIERVAAIAVSHLHVDHTGGIAEICTAASQRIAVFQTEMQASRGNYVTVPGQAHLDEAACADKTVLPTASIYPLADYPGLIAISAGGHTPGSTVYVAKVGGTYWVMAGDIAWTAYDIQNDIPKPAAYSALVVPEYGARMEELRHWLKALDDDPNTHVVVSHGEQALIDHGMTPYNRGPN